MKKKKTKRGTIATELTPVFDMLDELAYEHRRALAEKYRHIRYTLNVMEGTRNSFPQLHSILVQSVDDILHLLNTDSKIALDFNSTSKAVDELLKEVNVLGTMAQYRNEIARSFDVDRTQHKK